MSRMRLEIGHQPYPGYCLKRFLGSGGFGEVWEAETSDGGRVALKFLPADHATRASQETRAAQIVGNLRHPNLVAVDRIWCDQGYLVVSMELADGTLQDLHDAYQAEFGTPIAGEHLWLLLGQAAEAVDFLNTRQHMVDGRRVAVQHCDIKPTNLLLFGDAVKLSDFSLASLTTVTVKPHRRAGTFAYTAPEVFQGRLSDRTDQYALAVTYCYLRGGRMPFQNTPKEFSAGLVRPAPDLSMLPQSEQPVVGRALAPVPLDRWRSCVEFIDRLRRAVQSKTAASQARLAPRAPRAAAAPPSERRAGLRHPCRLSTSGRLLGEEGQRCWEGITADISQRGVGLLTDQQFKRGTVLVIKIGDARQGLARSLVARVRRCAARPQGGWFVGCTFPRPLATEELQSLVRILKPSPPEGAQAEPNRPPGRTVARAARS